ncbi:hypothetical protein Poli38472_003574 [Pythium oligandrum]|uniref:Pyridoxal phosphate phosphatase n=1 Tax=Pythium oligandrum TaxID=41045 RepID=A0A8K1CMI0_PYTOL|nr:hypothetical protein Poli38472_003574 [Pythium oligandrum]|eukprot:TMW65809.1 hypothetical protein Poli38472_003574 [Pythium oligandrum]
MASTLVVFDYDWSLVNENSDTFIFKLLCPELLDELSSRLEQQPSWTRVMDDLLGELHSRQPHVTPRDIKATLAQVPILPRMLDAVRLAVETHGATVKIVSDANSVYIQSMLDHHQLHEHITEVVTNPAAFEADSSRLRVRPYHPLEAEPHGCPLCPKNMCKGRILDRIHRAKAYDRVIYIGDGPGDFCAALRLTSDDVVLARADEEDGKKYGLLKRLIANAEQVQARVVQWRSGEDVYATFESEFQKE